MKIITSIENKGKAYIYNRTETAIYIFTATTHTIRIKETRCMKITTHDYYIQAHCSTNNSTNSSQGYYKHNLHNIQDVVFHRGYITKSHLITCLIGNQIVNLLLFSKLFILL